MRLADLLLSARLVAIEPSPCDASLEAMFAEDRYLAAAALAEACWASRRDTRMLLFAAQARYHAGHIAHAYRHVQAYLEAPGSDPNSLAFADELRGQMLGGAISVEVRRPAESRGAAVLTARRIGDVRPALQWSLSETTRIISVTLDRGAWQLSLASEGREHASVTAEISPQTVSVTLPGRPKPPPAVVRPRVDGPREREPKRRWGFTAVLASTAAAGAATLAAGITLDVRAIRENGAVLTVAGASSALAYGLCQSAWSTDCDAAARVEASYPSVTYHADRLRSLRLLGAGASLLGITAGVGLAGDGRFAGRWASRTARRARLGVGATLLAGGVVGTLLLQGPLRTELLGYQGEVPDGWRVGANYQRTMAVRTVLLGVAGTGLGLLLGEAMRALSRRSSPPLTVAATGNSITLAGTF